MGQAFHMRGYFYEWSGMADIFEERIAPSMKVLGEKVEGKEVFPADVCYDMDLIFQLADDILAGGDGSILLKSPWGSRTIDEMVERRIRFQMLYHDRASRQKPISAFSVPLHREAEILDEFQGGFRNIPSTVDAVYREYDMAIKAIESESSGIPIPEKGAGLSQDNLSAIRNHILQRVTYPQAAQEQGISGRVVCQLMIDRNGNIVQARIVKGAHPLLDKEVLRVVHLMPQWKPLPYGEEGEPMAVSIPLTFRLQD